MESQYSGNSDNEEGVGNEIQDFLKGMKCAHMWIDDCICVV